MKKKDTHKISNGVMLNAYPDSIGTKLSDTVKMLQMDEFKDAFSLFYVLPTFFNSDLDRGFSIIDYNLNKELVSKEDLEALDTLNIMLKFDIVLNHLSVASPQFQDLLKHGEESRYKDFFINWNTFWTGQGDKNVEDIIIPKEEFLNELFMRKSGLPILKVPFPDGSKQPYWNTFYQQITYQKITTSDLKIIEELTISEKQIVAEKINKSISEQLDIYSIDFECNDTIKNKIISIVERKAEYLGQMDVNAKSKLVWDFYEDTLEKVKNYGCKILRLDAFAYLHKEIGESNFFNKPGTWEYLDRIKEIAQRKELILLPEIHAEYGLNLHDEVAQKGYYIYDFFLPGLMIHTLEVGNNVALLKWAKEIIDKNYKTVNMLGCHDGIPVIDLKGKKVDGIYNQGLLEDKQIEDIMTVVMNRGGKVKNLYGPTGKKISYYQINATFFSALGENEQKLLLARALQVFMPGIPQVWYLDIFAGTNNYEAVEKAGSGGHKEINRTTLSMSDIKNDLKKNIVLNQLKLIKLRNTSKAFLGDMMINKSPEHKVDISWVNGSCNARLKANLITFKFTVESKAKGKNTVMSF